MSTPAPASSSAAASSTQQQLDELDALIQHMLKLPVHHLDEDPLKDFTATTPPTSSPDEENETSGERTRVKFHSAHEEPDDALQYHQDPEAEVPEMGTAKGLKVPLFDLPPAEHRDRPELERMSAEGFVTLSPSEPAAARIVQGPEGGRTRPRQPWWLSLPLRVNRLFERGSARLGKPGRWLRSQKGRRALGWTGIALLATSLAWFVLDWLRWNW